jgi:hypothetical protein
MYPTILNFRTVYNMHLYYDHALYSFPQYTFLWPEDSPQWPKHVVISIINRIQDNCVSTYPTILNFRIVSNMHLYYEHTLYSLTLYKFLWREDGPQSTKHDVVSLRNRIQDSCVLTYPTILNFRRVYNMHLYYDHTLYSFLLYTFLWPEDVPQWPKHVAVSITNRIQDSCVLTYPTILNIRIV